MEKDFVQSNLAEHVRLERAYQAEPEEFKAQLEGALINNPSSETLRVWHARLSYQMPEKKRKVSLTQLLVMCMVVGLLIKIHALPFIDGNWFIPRYASAIVVAGLILYFLLASESIHRAVVIAAVVFLCCVAYVAFLPGPAATLRVLYSVEYSPSVLMALIHFPIFALSLLGISFMGENWRSTNHRLAYVGYLGEMLIYTLLILFGGVVLTILTLVLFLNIGLSIEEWYYENIVVVGLATAPIVGTYLYDSIRHREGKFAPLLSNVFAPLFLITIITYLIATVMSGKSPFTDRDFLITLNGLLLITLAITVFSISGKKDAGLSRLADYINVALLVATLALNAAALIAILYRWADEGITVNRVVVTGANIIIFLHLIGLLFTYIAQARGSQDLDNMKRAVARYLPVYSAWSFFVLFFLPFIFKYQ